MSSQRETLPLAGTQSSNDIGFTHEELIREWTDLYARDIAPYLGEGERTLSMIMEEAGIDGRTAKTLIKNWIEEGVIVSVGKRRNTRGQTLDAWKCK